MFPTPIERTKPSTQILYKIALPISIIIWLLPLLAVALTSIRSGADINSGNYWGMPTSINFIENYTAVFTDSPLGYYILNSFKITIPTVIGAIVLSSLTGFALGVYRFKLNLFVFFMFVAGNFIPFPDTYGPSKRPFSFSWLIQLCMGVSGLPYSFSNRLLYFFHA